jgi:radical SAM protein with 4Fe4S-binding SPASM domain
MMIHRTDPKYSFYSQFNMETGLYIRSNILDETGRDTGREPFMASFPHLLDVGIMGHCDHGSSGLCMQSGVQCYQDGLNRWQPNMTLADFRRIARECAGKVYQFALGGRGDPDMHEDFEAILACCREYGIVPNITTSGLGLTWTKASIIRRYCGAAAVSWYRSEHTLVALQLLHNAGVHTNIHFVLGNNSIDEAIEMITQRKIPPGVSRVIFLLHKPVGLGTGENVLDVMDKRVQQFFALFNDEANCNLAGFDSCCVPALMNMAIKVHPASLEPCEGGRFSAYITPDMRMLPCSFDQDLHWAVDMRQLTIEEVWNSGKFEDFRDRMRTRCPECSLQELCLGGCPVVPEIVLCGMVRGGMKHESQA